MRVLVWVAGVASMLVAFAATRLSIALSHRSGVLDMPNVRSSHSQPIPRLGGIGILAAVAVTVGIVALVGRGFPGGSSTMTKPVMVMLGAGVGMAAIGLYDDLYGLRPFLKLLGQLIVAGAIAALGYQVDSVQFADWGPLALGWAAVPVTILWLAGFTNIFNFMDGINGISAVTAASYFLFLSALAWFEGASDLTLLGIVLAGACLGFLPHNFPVARTFMGDTGSLFLGIVLAFYVVFLAQRQPAVLLPAVLVCAVYLWDSGFTILCRLKRRENLFDAHRSHLYQRLVQAGHSHARITTLYLILHLVLGSLALACYGSTGLLRAGVIAMSALILAAFTGTVYWVEERRSRAGIPQDQGRAA